MQLDTAEAYKTSSCIARSMDPDVDVVVGNVTFKEYRTVLCCISEYFDAAFRSGMKESISHSFTFPDRDPKEWELLMSVFGLNLTTKLEPSNIITLLPWCDELCMSSAMEACDTVYYEQVISPGVVRVFTKNSSANEIEVLREFYDKLDVCIQYNLTRCLQHACQSLRYVFEDKPEELPLDLVKATIRFLKNDVVLDCLWDKFRRYVPLRTRPEESAMKATIRNELDPIRVYQKLQKLATLKEDPLSGAARIVVERAGTPNVNGVYHRTGSIEGFNTYEKPGGAFRIQIYKSGCHGQWYIISKDGHLMYKTRTVYRTRKNPPSSPVYRTGKNPPSSPDSWMAVRNGRGPSPSILRFTELKRKEQR